MVGVRLRGGRRPAAGPAFRRRADARGAIQGGSRRPSRGLRAERDLRLPRARGRARSTSGRRGPAPSEPVAARPARDDRQLAHPGRPRHGVGQRPVPAAVDGSHSPAARVVDGSGGATARRPCSPVENGRRGQARAGDCIARLSPRYPTIEVRLADTSLTVDDSVLLAAVVRALVATLIEDARQGRPPEPTGSRARTSTCSRRPGTACLPGRSPTTRPPRSPRSSRGCTSGSAARCGLSATRSRRRGAGTAGAAGHRGGAAA